MTARNAFYAQSGGVTAVINATACAVIETSRKHPQKIGKLFAGRNGILGALADLVAGLTLLEHFLARGRIAVGEGRSAQRKTNESSRSRNLEEIHIRSPVLQCRP